MNTWKIILATLVIFGAGIVTGRLLTSRVLDPKSQPEQTSVVTHGNPSTEKHKLPPPLPGMLRKDFIDRLDKELKLTPDQRERIEKVIGHGQEQARALWRDVEPEMHKTLGATKEKIRAVLTPEQQAQFNHLLKQKTRVPNRPPADESSTNAAGPMQLDLDWSFCWFVNPKPACHGTNAAPAECL